MVRNRKFTRVDSNSCATKGRYIGSTPLQAAKKCATKYFQELQKNGNDVDGYKIMVIRETTRGSKKNLFAYKISRISIPVHQLYTVNMHSDEQIIPVIYRHKIYVYKTNVPDEYKKNPKNDNLNITIMSPIINNIKVNDMIIEV